MFQTSDIDESKEMQNRLPHFHTIPSSVVLEILLALSRVAQVALIEIYFDTVNGFRNKDAPCCERRT
ncbi:hypothetical protein T05_597 [Trichinella murrelli]|uniref:Uncharacterized protein n=1 Tax=Trichinella murrelli TaxID=144512 RepID=A0A0V0SYM1_9BILA|nr:hypothetical protein T05_597 [Trichinella murrelli]